MAFFVALYQLLHLDCKLGEKIIKLNPSINSILSQTSIDTTNATDICVDQNGHVFCIFGGNSNETKIIEYDNNLNEVNTKMIGRTFNTGYVFAMGNNIIAMLNDYGSGTCTFVNYANLPINFDSYQDFVKYVMQQLN